MKRTFYDTHVHAMNLDHPNLIKFIKRNNLGLLIGVISIPGIEKLFNLLGVKKLKYAMNLLSLMEHSIGDYFKRLEDDLLNIDGKLLLDGVEFESIILTPLMMDFGKKLTLDYDLHYDLRSKPIIDQTIDLFNGIKYFKEIDKNNILEIYPFLGITPNGDNYSLDYLKNEIFNKYFSEFDLENRREKLKNNMGSFDGNIDNLRNYSFAGIKLYPPLGFDPWPDSVVEREKVMYIYRKCVELSIPITTHCGDTGYSVISKKNSELYTSPKRWEKVLEQDEFKTLKICFAHFGGKFKSSKIDNLKIGIAKLAFKYQNVYTDVSARCYCDKDYKNLLRIIDKISKEENKDKDLLIRKVLFGSDVMINLLHTDSYKTYVSTFLTTNELNSHYKNLLCEENPRRFLFGD